MALLENPDSSPQEYSYSYEPFARLISDIDEKFLMAAPYARRITVLATGPGNDISLLHKLGKFEDHSRIIGIDTDLGALKQARDRMESEGIANEGHRVDFINGSAESVPLANESQELVVGLNFIHMTDPEKVIHEAARILKPGGVFMMNTAYAKDVAYPPGTERMWGLVVAYARRELKDIYGYTDVQNPVNLINHSTEDFIHIARKAGMETATWNDEYELDKAALEAISGYHGFAEGAIPGVPVELSAPALVRAVGPMLNRVGKASAPRGWFSMYAKKTA